MTIPSIALVANGDILIDSKIQPLLKHFSYVIAVDGGLKHCDRMGIEPNLIVGDLDSITPDLLTKYEHVTIHKYPVKKDETDIELAVHEALKLKPESIHLFGVLGKRTDHTLNNLFLASRFPDLMHIYTEWEVIIFIKSQQWIPCFPGQVVSLYPLGAPAKGVTSEGLEWELRDATLDQSFFSQSNVCLAEGFSLSVAEGTVMCSLLLNS